MSKTHRLLLLGLVLAALGTHNTVCTDDKVTVGHLGNCPAGGDGSEECSADGGKKTEEEGSARQDSATRDKGEHADTQTPRSRYDNGTFELKLDLSQFCKYTTLFRSDADIEKLNRGMTSDESDIGVKDQDLCCETLTLLEKQYGVKWDIQGRPWDVPSITVNGTELYQFAQTGNCLPMGSSKKKCKGTCREEYRMTPLLARKPYNIDAANYQFVLFPLKAYCACKSK